MKHPTNERNPLAIIALAGAVGLIVATLFLFAFLFIIPNWGNAFDFYPNWAGSRAVFGGESPYSREMTERIQIAMYGYVRGLDVDQNSFAHPAYSAFLMLPVAMLDAPLATAVWMTFQLLAVGFSILLWLDLLNWRPHPLVFGLVLFGCLVALRHPVNIYLLGQFPGSVLLGFSVAVWLLQRKRDAVAGIALVMCTVPPTVGGTMALVLAGSLALTGRWKTLAALLASLAVFTSITFLLVGFWIPDWLSMLNQYTHYAHPVWPPSVLQLPLAELGLVIAVVMIFATSLARFVRDRGRQHLLELSLTILLCGLVLLPTTGTYYLVLIIPALLATFAYGSVAAISGAIVTILITWLIMASTNGKGSDVEVVIVPIMAWVSWRLALRYPRVHRATQQELDPAPNQPPLVIS